MAITRTSTKDMTREQWLESRKLGVGGSDVSCILGLNKYKSQLALWIEKTAKEVEDFDNEAMLQGRMIEDVVAQRFTMESGLKVKKCNYLISNSDYPHAIANVDRLVVGQNAGLECKTVNAYGAKNYTSSQFNPSYYCQCVHYMAVTGCERWYLAVMILGIDFKVYMLTTKEDDVCPEWCESTTVVSQEEIDTMKERVNEFWGYVERQEEPPIMAIPCESEELNKLYPNSETELECDLTAYAKELDKLEELKEQKKQIEDEIDSTQAVIKGVLENAESGFTDTYKVTWKTSTRTTFDKAKLLKEHSEIDGSQYVKTSTSRVFNIKRLAKEV